MLAQGPLRLWRKAREPSRRMAKAALITAMLTLVASCGDRSANGPIGVSVIGAQDEFRAPLTHIDSLAGAISFAATAQGLVSYDDAGNVIPGLAQRWIVVDDGKSYIFRLRRARWPTASASTHEM